MMNSVVDGSLSPAWRNAGDTRINCKPHEVFQRVLTFSGQFLSDGCTTNFENYPASGDTVVMNCHSICDSMNHRNMPCCPELKRSFTLTHACFISLADGVFSKPKNHSNGVKSTLMQTGISGKTLK